MDDGVNVVDASRHRESCSTSIGTVRCPVLIQRSYSEVTRDKVLHSRECCFKTCFFHAVLEVLVKISFRSVHTVRMREHSHSRDYSGLAVAQQSDGNLMLVKVGGMGRHAQRIHRPERVKVGIRESSDIGTIAPWTPQYKQIGYAAIHARWPGRQLLGTGIARLEVDLSQRSSVQKVAHLLQLRFPGEGGERNRLRGNLHPRVCHFLELKRVKPGACLKGYVPVGQSGG